MPATSAYGNEPIWRKSTRSVNDGACVEVGTFAGIVGIRDSTDRDGCELCCSAAVWQSFIAWTKTAGVSPRLRP
jgi:hypothetical protein